MAREGFGGFSEEAPWLCEPEKKMKMEEKKEGIDKQRSQRRWCYESEGRSRPRCVQQSSMLPPARAEHAEERCPFYRTSRRSSRQRDGEQEQERDDASD